MLIKMNQMKNIRIEKVTLNVGAGKDQGKLERGIKLLKLLTGVDPVKTVTMKRVPSWGLRPNLPIVFGGVHVSSIGKPLLEKFSAKLTRQYPKTSTRVVFDRRQVFSHPWWHLRT